MGSMKAYRRIVWGLLVLSIIGTMVYGYFLLENRVPDQLMLRIDRKEEFDFAFPLTGEIDVSNEKENSVSVFQSGNEPISGNRIKFNFNTPFSIKAETAGKYKLFVKLFGFIQLKEMEIQVVEPVAVFPAGKTVGIYVETDGIMVLGTGEVTGKDGLSYEPAENVVYTGDYIVSVNGTKVKTIEELSSQLQTRAKEAVRLGIRRKGEEQEVLISAVEAVDGSYKLGIWTRQDTQGIGTITFVDENGKFGALGHGITDSDTGLPVEISEGTIYEATILDIVKGEVGKPGEMVGMIRVSDTTKLGKIERNGEEGIFGTALKKKGLETDAMPIGFKQEIEEGKAQIICNLGEGERFYDIEIEKIQLNSPNVNKSMVIRITDEELLATTNGIVQGMSGSPIIQNGKLIGAVTHVFVQNPAKGYGIFIENMLES